MATEKKLTAVEWLVEQIIKEKSLIDLDIEQAKEMFKQQIIDAYVNGSVDSYKKEPKNGGGTKYYNETFKNE